MRKCKRNICKKFGYFRCCLECEEKCFNGCTLDMDSLNLRECSEEINGMFYIVRDKLNKQYKDSDLFEKSLIRALKERKMNYEVVEDVPDEGFGIIFEPNEIGLLKPVEFNNVEDHNPTARVILKHIRDLLNKSDEDIDVTFLGLGRINGYIFHELFLENSIECKCTINTVRSTTSDDEIQVYLNEPNSIIVCGLPYGTDMSKFNINEDVKIIDPSGIFRNDERVVFGIREIGKATNKLICNLNGMAQLK